MQVVYAVDSRVVPMPDGSQVRVIMGSHWATSDPVVRQHPDLFSSDPGTGLSYTATPVETATAAPGEQRSVRRG